MNYLRKILIGTIFFIVSNFCSTLFAQSEYQNRITNLISNFEKDLEKLNIVTGRNEVQRVINEITRNYFRGANINLIEDDLTKRSSNSKSSREATLKNYLYNIYDRNMTIAFSRIKIEKACLSKKKETLIFVSLNSTITGNNLNTKRVNRIFEIEEDEGDLYIAAMTFEDSPLLSQCRKEIKLRDKEQPTSNDNIVITNEPSEENNKKIKELTGESQNLRKEQRRLNGIVSDLQEEMRVNNLKCQNEVVTWRTKAQNAERDLSSLKSKNKSLTAELDTFKVREFRRKRAEEIADSIARANKKQGRDSLDKAQFVYEDFKERKKAFNKKRYPTKEEKDAFKKEEEKSMTYVWNIMKDYEKYRNAENELAIVDILGNNLGGMIEKLDEDDGKKAAKEANKELLVSLGNVLKSGNYDELQKAEEVIEEIEEYITIEKQRTEITAALKRGISDYEKGNYTSALNIFSRYDKYLFQQDEGLVYEVKYRYGTILLWNLGNVTQMRGILRRNAKVRQDINDRIGVGIEFLTDVERNAEVSLQKKATKALVKHYRR